MKTHLKFTGFIILLTGLLAFGLAFGQVHSIQAASCTVTSAADSGTGSLRALLADTGCDLITFGGDTTIYLASHLVLSQDVTIDGGTNQVVINGDNAVQQFLVNAGVTAALHNLNLENGYSAGDGGAINNAGSLIVSGCAFSNNHTAQNGGAIENAGSGVLTVTDSTFTGNYGTGQSTVDDFGIITVGTEGGAIINYGTLTVTDSTFTGNWAINGGAIANNYSLSVSGSFFTDNTAVQNVFVPSGIGGAIYNDYGTAIVTNNTFFANASAYGGALGNVGYLTVVNSMIKDNTGTDFGQGISASGTWNNGGITIRNTIFDGNTCLNSEFAQYTNGDHNMIINPNGQYYQCLATLLDPLQDESLRLGPMGTYGGPTQLFPLLPDSFAINAGSNADCPAVDQRGQPRPGSAACDIGPFESQGYTLIPLDGATPQSTWPTTQFPQPLTLTVSPLNSLDPVDGGKVEFSWPFALRYPGLTSFGGWDSVTIANGTVSMAATANAMTGSYTVDAVTRGAAWVHFSLTNACIAGTKTVTNANDSGSGSLRQAVLVSCPGDTIMFNNDYTINLTAPVRIYRDLTIDGTGHKITLSGGGTTGVFDIKWANVNIQNLTVANGHAASGGGISFNGYFDQDFSLTLNNVTFTGNISPGGGAIHMAAGHLTATNCTFSGNQATVGGAIYYDWSGTHAGNMTLTNVTMVGNTGAPAGIFGYSIANTHINNSILANMTLNGNQAQNMNCSLEIEGKIEGTNNLVNDILCIGLSANVDFLAQGLYDQYAPGEVAGSVQLGTLGDYGGDTQTVPLLTGSAAIDAGNPELCPATDQRGEARPQDGDSDGTATCDIGAYEKPATSEDWLMITGQTNSLTVAAGATARFGAAASGHPAPTLQWQVSTDSGATWSDIPGATTSPLAFAATAADNGKKYHAVFTNLTGSITTTAAPLTVSGSAQAATVTLGSLAQAYDGTPKVVTVTTSPTNLLVGVTYNGSQTPPTAAGTYTVVATVISNSYTGSASGTLVISGTSATVTLTDLDQTYDGTAKPVTVTTTPTGLNVSITYDGSTTAPVNAGSYAVVATITDANYQGSASGTLTIQPKAASVTPDPAIKVYGEADPVRTGTLSGFITSDGVTAVYSRTSGEAVGAYTISAVMSPAAALGNYTVTYNNAVFTITSRPIQVTADAKTKVVGEADTPLTYQVTSGSLVFSDTFSGALARDPGEDVGVYAIQQGTLALGSNYTLTYIGADFTILDVELNTAPAANPSGPYLAPINTIIPFDGSASSDPDDNLLSYAWTFGDGMTGTGAQPSHSYTAAGIYDVCLVVNDGLVDSDPACTLAVVYDPSGGFVTGGGWIASPAGAYLPDPFLTGKATFGFVSKYIKGATVPNGNTEFQFQAGGFNFHSTSYDWLVVSKDQVTAQFKGAGTVNGSLDPNGNAYKFMLWAGDGTPDTFRIRIWWEDADAVEHDVYDNGFDQAIGGGSIVVHTGK